MRIKISVAGYRCFPRHPSAEFEVGAGVTAFVGENNAGKSAAMRLLHDLRPVLQGVASPRYLNKLLQAPEPVEFGREVRNPSEILFNGGAAELVLSIQVSDFGGTRDELPAYPAHLQLTMNRDFAWRAVWVDSKGTMLFIDDHDRSYVHNAPDTRTGDAKPIMDALRILANVVYIPSCRQTPRGGGNAFDAPIGDQLVQEWDDMQNGIDKRKNAQAQDIEQTLASLFGFDNVHVSPTVGQNTGMQFRISGAGQFRTDEMGTGLSQTFTALHATATKTPSLILIDEPEFSLHPTLQFRFLSELQKRASLGLVFSTHNLGLAMNAADRTYSVTRQAGNRSTQGRPWSRISLLAETPELPALLGALSYPSYGDTATRHVLLVEGPTDLRLIQILLQKLRVADQVVCVHMGGNTTIRSLEHAKAQLAGVKRLCARVWCLIDSEAGAEGRIEADRQAFLNLCGQMDIPSHATKFRATENYLTEAACKSTIDEHASAPQPYSPPTKQAQGWTKQQAWQIAFDMEPNEFQDVGAFLERIATSIRQSRPAAAAH